MTGIEKIEKIVQEKKIELTRFVYTDSDGVTRGYQSTASSLSGDLVRGHTYTTAQPMFSVHDEVIPDSFYGPVGEVLAIPDLDTFTPLPYAEASALVICDFYDIDTYEPLPVCPRSALKKTLADYPFEVCAAFENEFYFVLKNEKGEIVSAENSLCFDTAGMNSTIDIVLEIVRNLQAQGIEVEKHYPEFGPGQHEVVIKYRKALRAADEQILFKETVRAIARKHGLYASFMPKPFQNKSGSGVHIHLSLWKDGENVFYDGSKACGYSDTAKYFIGGILEHVEAILAFTTPTVTSYKRLLPHNFASAFAAYGNANKEAAIRLIKGLRGNEKKGFNIEFKPADGAANPYLALNALLIAGLEGIEKKIDPGPELLQDPALLSAEEMLQRNIRELPICLGESLAALKQDELFARKLDPLFYSEYIKQKTYNWRKYLRHVSTWEIEQFATIF